MANKIKGEISVSVGGEAYTLRLDFNALCDFEEETGKGASDTLKAVEAGTARMTDLRALVFAALKQEHPDASVKLAGRILTEAPGALMEAAAAAFGTGEADQGNAESQQPAA